MTYDRGTMPKGRKQRVNERERERMQDESSRVRSSRGSQASVRSWRGTDREPSPSHSFARWSSLLHCPPAFPRMGACRAVPRRRVALKKCGVPTRDARVGVGLGSSAAHCHLGRGLLACWASDRLACRAVPLPLYCTSQSPAGAAAAGVPGREKVSEVRG